MATFAVNASDETVKALSEIMESMTIDGEKKADTLQRIFDIAAKYADGETLKSGGVDVSALDAALDHIRSAFVTAVTGKEQIIADCAAKIADIKTKKDQLETDLRAKIAIAEDAKAQAEQVAVEAQKAADQALKEADTARESAETNAALAAEKDKTILSLTDKLTAAEAKAGGYDDLVQAKADAEAQIASLTTNIEVQKKEHERILNEEKESAQRALTEAHKDSETQLRELKAQMDRAVSDTQKDAALAQEKAVSEAVQQVSEKAQADLRQADKENSRLQAKMELLTEQIAALQAQIDKLSKNDK